MFKIVVLIILMSGDTKFLKSDASYKTLPECQKMVPVLYVNLTRAIGPAGKVQVGCTTEKAIQELEDKINGKKGQEI